MLRLKQLRIEGNMSQRALAAKIGTSQKAIDLWEKGYTEPKAGILIKLANLFECSADYLLGREDDFGSVNVMRDLTGNEKQILSLYSALTKKQQEELNDYASFLLSKQ